MKISQKIKAGDKSLNIQANQLLVNVENYYQKSKRDILEKPVYQIITPKTIENLIYHAKKHNDYNTAIELIDLKLKDTSYELEKKHTSNLMLQKAILYQQSGNVKKSINALREYKNFSEKKEKEYYLCLGKIISQHFNSADKLSLYLNKLKKIKEIRINDDALASLYWRLGILYQSYDIKKSKENLIIHRDHCRYGSYQVPHNYQCNALTLLSKNKQEKIILNKISKIKNILFDAYEMYIGIDNFAFLEKCIISNLLMIALADSLQGRVVQYYKKLFFCRKLFHIYGIHHTDEAMSEIFYSIKVYFPEAFEILFSKDISKFIINNSMCSIIKDIYIEVSHDILYMTNNHIDIIDIYNGLNKIA